MSVYGVHVARCLRERMSATCVLRKADGERRFRDLLSKEILLVEEEDYGRINKKLVITDGVKQRE